MVSTQTEAANGDFHAEPKRVQRGRRGPGPVSYTHLDVYKRQIQEYIRGQSLERAKKPFPWQQVLDLAIGLSRGLAAAHRRGVLHRDLKPGNVMLPSDGGGAKLLDFGLAKLLDTNQSQTMDVAASQEVAKISDEQRKVTELSLIHI